MSQAALFSLAPKITRLIRADHASILTVFRRYTADTPAHLRQALADRMCVMLEIHSKLEEEVFYPALRELYPSHEVIQKCGAEHAELQRLIARLRRLTTEDIGFDAAVLNLMRQFLHHMADEETVLLPAAERVLADYLGELGGRMRRRRFELARPRAGEIASGWVRSVPVSRVALVAGAFGLGLLLASVLAHRPGTDSD